MHSNVHSKSLGDRHVLNKGLSIKIMPLALVKRNVIVIMEISLIQWKRLVHIKLRLAV